MSRRFLRSSTGWAALLLVGISIIQCAGATEWAGTDKTDANARCEDVQWLISQFVEHYAYRDQIDVDWDSVRSQYTREARAADSRDAWVHVLERVVSTLHDHHAVLGTNTSSSPRLIPTGTDIWATISHQQAIISQVRQDSPAMNAGLRAGDRIMAIGGVATMQAIKDNLPYGLTLANAGEFTLAQLLAGVHDQVRSWIVARDGAKPLPVVLPAYHSISTPQPVSWHWQNKAIGYIRINNSLGDPRAVASFDAAIRALRSAHGLVLDLRDTPSGGDTDVADPILGRFVSRKMPYQLLAESAPAAQSVGHARAWSVTPRGPFTFDAPLVVLVNRWTGSMGEGMAVGLEGLHRATTVGTAMARLKGGTQAFRLPNTDISVDFPTYRIYQVNGQPRERFLPSVQVTGQMLRRATSKDMILETGEATLRSLIRQQSSKNVE